MRERNFVIEAFKLRLGDSEAETGLVVDHLFSLPFPFASIPFDSERELTLREISEKFEKYPSSALEKSRGARFRSILANKRLTNIVIVGKSASYHSHVHTGTSSFALLALSFFLRTLITSCRRLFFFFEDFSFNSTAPSDSRRKIVPPR